MTATVTTFTIIHIGSEGPEPTPYAVVVAQGGDGKSVAARADGDLSWLAIGNPVSNRRRRPTARPRIRSRTENMSTER